jgi:hypothetical protein
MLSYSAYINVLAILLQISYKESLNVLAITLIEKPLSILLSIINSVKSIANRLANSSSY